jgi:hypothetical protein
VVLVGAWQPAMTIDPSKRVDPMRLSINVGRDGRTWVL